SSGSWALKGGRWEKGGRVLVWSHTWAFLFRGWLAGGRRSRGACSGGLGYGKRCDSRGGPAGAGRSRGGGPAGAGRSGEERGSEEGASRRGRTGRSPRPPGAAPRRGVRAALAQRGPAAGTGRAS